MTTPFCDSALMTSSLLPGASVLTVHWNCGGWGYMEGVGTVTMGRSEIIAPPIPPPLPQVSCATQYLEYCVNRLKTSDKAIHNFLISCYAKSNDSKSFQKLLDYLVAQATLVRMRCLSICSYNEDFIFHRRQFYMMHTMPSDCAWSTI